MGSDSKHGSDVKVSLENMEKVVIKEVVEKEKSELKTETALRLHHREVDAYFEKVSTLDDNLNKAYTIVWDMCSEDLRGKIKAVSEFSKISTDMDVIKLLEEIRKIVYNFQAKRYTPHNMFIALKKFVEIRQIHDETVQEWYEIFKLQVKVFESVGGSIGKHRVLLSDQNFDEDQADVKISDMNPHEEAAKETFLAYMFLNNADNARFGGIKIC